MGPGRAQDHDVAATRVRDEPSERVGDVRSAAFELQAAPGLRRRVGDCPSDTRAPILDTMLRASGLRRHRQRQRRRHDRSQDEIPCQEARSHGAHVYTSLRPVAAPARRKSALLDCRQQLTRELIVDVPFSTRFVNPPPGRGTGVAKLQTGRPSTDPEAPEACRQIRAPATGSSHPWPTQCPPSTPSARDCRRSPAGDLPRRSLARCGCRR